MESFVTPGVYVQEVPTGTAPIVGAGTSTPAFIGMMPDTIDLVDMDTSATPPVPKAFTPPPAGTVKVVTNFTEFKNYFGDFSRYEPQRVLAQAVLGFFQNGGTRCYVTRMAPPATSPDPMMDLVAAVPPASLLSALDPIDDIALVAAPGMANAAAWAALSTYCATAGDRFAILDSKPDVTGGFPDGLTSFQGSSAADRPAASDYAAFYFPWIQVSDPALKALTPTSDGLAYVPPSGHVAGVFARVDAARGVHKAPANEPIRGAVGLKFAVSKAQQGLLNPEGTDVIRTLNGAITIWGARTVGGDANGDFKYVSSRRLFIYLKRSIDQGTQFAVFEPNNADLWAKITRNVSAFLTGLWRDGGLFGTKPEEAFYVKCDAETNPPDQRDLGQVVAEIGVAINKPAEFVVFRIGQKTS